MLPSGVAFATPSRRRILVALVGASLPWLAGLLRGLLLLLFPLLGLFGLALLVVFQPFLLRGFRFLDATFLFAVGSRGCGGSDTLPLGFGVSGALADLQEATYH